MTIYQHFRPEEKEFIDQVLNWRRSVEDTYAPRLTDFLDPREQDILNKIIGSNQDAKVKLFGGSPDTERQRAIIYPEYYQVQDEDFKITLFEIDYPKKFITLEHRQVLGSIMSLGLKRGKFGDIIFQDDRIQFFVAADVESYVELNLTAIGRASITLKKQDLNQAMRTNEHWHETIAIVSSMRLDTVVSSLNNISRQKSQDLIHQGLVKVNWTSVDNPAFECGEKDVISVRGYGRSKIIEIEGKTKKDKYKIIAGKQK